MAIAYDQEYVRNRVEVSDGECWEWSKSRNPEGYGRVKNDKAHRVAYRAFVGEIPEGMCVLHRCDNPSCCSPEHLFLGTKADNNADARAKGRAILSFPGTSNPRSKLTEEQINQIRAYPEKRDGGPGNTKIAAEFGITREYCWVLRNKAQGGESSL